MNKNDVTVRKKEIQTTGTDRHRKKEGSKNRGADITLRLDHWNGQAVVAITGSCSYPLARRSSRPAFSPSSRKMQANPISHRVSRQKPNRKRSEKGRNTQNLE